MSVSVLVTTAAGAFATGLTLGAFTLAPRVGPWRAARPSVTPDATQNAMPAVIVVPMTDLGHDSVPLRASATREAIARVPSEEIDLVRLLAALEAQGIPPRRLNP